MSGPQSRRQFLRRAGRLGISAAGLTWLAGCGAWSPPAEPAAAEHTVRRIGFLANPSLRTLPVERFEQGLRDHGWVVGETVVITYRSAEGSVAALPDLAAELIGLHVEVIVTHGNSATRTARDATSSIPIVYAAGSADPLASALVSSLARPEGNVTGLVGEEANLDGKRLELLMELVSGISRIAMLLSPGPGLGRPLTETARSLGVELQPLRVRPRDDLEDLFAAATTAGVGGLVVGGQAGPLGTTNATRIVDLAAKYRLPAVYHTGEFAEAAGLLVYGPNRPELYRHAA